MARTATTAATWTDVAAVNSKSDPCRRWLVQLSDGGEYRCLNPEAVKSGDRWCKGYIFSKESPKRCKHIRAAIAGGVGVRPLHSDAPVDPCLAKAREIFADMLNCPVAVGDTAARREAMARILARHLETWVKPAASSPSAQFRSTQGVRMFTLED